MRIRIPGPVALLLLLQAGSAIAEVTIATDKPTYEVGEIVHITAHNAGPEDEELVSYPHVVIWNMDTEECLVGCVGLPVVEPFPAGATITWDRDTGSASDAPGSYLVRIAVHDGPSTSYVLTAGVPADDKSWTTLKSRYR